MIKQNEAEVYLFGSWANHTERTTSDIDIAVVPKPGFRETSLSLLRGRLEESDVPYRVEVVDFSQAARGFRSQALKGAVPWIG